MPGKRFPIELRAASVMFAMALFVNSPVAARVKTIHNFGSGRDGISPRAGMVFDAAGNLYGTTQQGGGYYGRGTVFELTPNGSGGWTEKKLHNFGNGRDGSYPNAGLIFDAEGNLYGTTEFGGTNDDGTVFELTPNGNGGWTEKTLHNFGTGEDGQIPEAGLIFDAAGNIYGTTAYGGAYRSGTVFELTPNGSGGWTEEKLHNFGNRFDGATPLSGLIFDSSGNLFGTAAQGGNYPCAGYGCGTVYEMTPNGSGGWTENTLHNFRGFSYGNGGDGSNPDAGLIFDAAGNLYGTTAGGGDHPCFGYGVGCGTVFEMTPNGSGGWTEKTLHNFGAGEDGQDPEAGLIFDATGNLYGATAYGGVYGHGMVFEMTPNGSGGWRERTLHNCRGASHTPLAGVIFDADGNIYGTTSAGGSYNLGAAFELTP